MELPNPNYDPEKRRIIEERLAKRQKEREDRHTKMKIKLGEKECAPEEDREKFQITFKEMQNKAIELIEKISTDAAKVEDNSKIAYEKLTELKDFLSSHSYHLPGYEMQNYMEEVRTTESKFVAQKEKAPKKKFQFAKSSKKVTPAKEEQKDKKPPQETSESGTSITLSKDDISMTNMKDIKFTEKKSEKQDCYCYIRENTKSSLSLEPEIVVKQLYCDKNSDCEISVPVISGSALIYNCDNCKFQLSAHQVRIHKSQNCTFTLFSGSVPVIEDCSGLVFKSLPPSEIPSIYQSTPNQCSNVFDFNWHKKERSPNWTYISP